MVEGAPLPDVVQFHGGVVDLIPDWERRAHFPMTPVMDDGGYRRVWTGPWPPDERIGIAVGRTSGIVKVFDPEGFTVPREELDKVAHVTVYRRVSASILPEVARTHGMFRGAVYEPEGAE